MQLPSTVLLICLLVVLTAPSEAMAQETRVLIPDGREASAFAAWGDGGDVCLTTGSSTEVVAEGEQSLRVEVTFDPQNPWWPALALDLPLDASALEFPLLQMQVWVPPEAADMPPGTVNLSLYQGDERVSAGALRQPQPGAWNELSVGLGGLEPVEGHPARLKLAWRPPEGDTGTYVFFVDAVRLVAGDEGHRPYTQLKDLCIVTPLVNQGDPVAAIVAPRAGRYEEAVAAIQEAVRRAAGCELPVLGDAEACQEVLAQRPVIVLGNMATSRFMHELYREYYTYLDLKYPGAGGFVVRSLHNPYATGHNVILVGGSDDEGVLKAARRLAELLPDDGDLSLGWLMEIELGEGLEPPQIGETVYGWRDSYRERPDGTGYGYAPTTYFGWNPISIQAALYYMTGEEEYLREFVRLALPDPEDVPVEVRTSEAFYSMLHPLVENYHYRAHVMDMIWDLVEESPLLDDETRLRITNELRAHQDFIDAEDDYSPPRGTSRHGSYDLLCIYTGSRYFAKYYPAPRWQTRLQNVRDAFSWWLQHPTWGELDTLGWVNTSIEPVLEYWHLADPQTYVDSGNARTMMSSQEMLWTGRAHEQSNRCQTLSLMHRASWLLDDGRYAWLVRQAGFDMDRFRIGQSWWPGPQIEVAPPSDLIGRISVMPLAQPHADRVGAPFTAAEGYQFLSYRTGLGPDDGYLLLDGFDGGGRNPHHVSSIKYLRFTDRFALDGYENMVTILRDGMSELRVPKAARLDAAVALDGIAWVRSTVPDEAFSSWRRDLLWVDDEFAIVADAVTAREPGEFEVTCRWRPMGPGILAPDGVFGGQNAGGMHATFVCAQPAMTSIEGGILNQQRNVELAQDETLGFVNVIYHEESARQFRIGMLPVGESAALITGDLRGVVGAGPFMTAAADEGGLELRGALSLIGPDVICLMGGSSLTGERVLVDATRPVSLVWRLEDRTVHLQADEELQLALALSEDARPTLDGAEVDRPHDAVLVTLRIPPGTHVIEGATPREDVAGRIEAALSSLEERLEPPAAPEPPQVAALEELEPEWQVDLGAPVTHVLQAGEVLWAATEQPALHLVRHGQEAPFRSLELPAKLNALEALPPDAPGEVRVVGGGDDDMLRAWDAGGDLVWERPSHVSETFKVGDRYEAPWFTDPQRKPGILSLMVADVTGAGELEIVVGRPSTVEYWSLGGELLARVPIQWGDVRELALLQHPEGPRVLVGKHVAGYSNVSVLDADRTLVTNGAYTAVAEGATRMQAWMQKGIGSLHAVDLDGDGVQEVVVAHTGHWNDVRAFTADGSTVRWQRAFGPARPRSHFIRDVAVGDFAPADGVEVVAGMANGWVVCISAAGEVLYSRRFGAAITGLQVVPSGLMVGLESGHAYHLSPTGDVVKGVDLGSRISAMAADAGNAIALGTGDGMLVEVAP